MAEQLVPKSFELEGRKSVRWQKFQEVHEYGQGKGLKSKVRETEELVAVVLPWKGDNKVIFTANDDIIVVAPLSPDSVRDMANYNDQLTSRLSTDNVVEPVADYEEVSFRLLQNATDRYKAKVLMYKLGSIADRKGEKEEIDKVADEVLAESKKRSIAHMREKRQSANVAFRAGLEFAQVDSARKAADEILRGDLDFSIFDVDEAPSEPDKNPLFESRESNLMSRKRIFDSFELAKLAGDPKTMGIEIKLVLHEGKGEDTLRAIRAAVEHSTVYEDEYKKLPLELQLAMDQAILRFERNWNDLSKRNR